MVIHETAGIENATLGDSEIREYVTVHDSTIGSDSRIYERVSIKKSTIGKSVDINANTYVENSVIGANVTVTEDVSAGTVVRGTTDL